MSSEAKTPRVKKVLARPYACSVDRCEDQARVKGMCTACYYRLYRTGSLEFASDNPRRYRKRTGRPRSKRLCGLPGCTERHYAKDLCYKHWRQAKRMSESPQLTDEEVKRVPIHPLLPHIRECVERHGEVQTAQMFGIHHGNIHHLLNRNKAIDIDTADRICLKLGLPFDALFNSQGVAQ